MKHPLNISTVFKLPVFGLLASLVACGGGGSSSDGVSTATISGVIVAAPVNGAQVSIVDAYGNVVVEPVTTNVSGQYSLSIPVGNLGQALIIKSSGGSFTDEATGNNGAAGNMMAYMEASSISDGGSISLTPGSTIVADLMMNYGKSMADATSAFAGAFGYTPDVSITPADASVAPAAGLSDDAKLSGFRAAAFSQLAMDLLLSQNDQFEMFAALAKDLSDGVLNGVDASGAVVVGATGVALEANIQNRFTAALVNFHDGVRDQTGLANDQIGHLPFSKIALSNSYKIEYVPGMMAAMEGKTKFKLHITDKVTGAAESGLSVTLMPMMNMAGGMRHSTPNMNCVAASAGNGYYDCTAYYLMPSVMAGGMSMGYWELTVMAGKGESVTFYPQVMMAMGDTVKVQLKGSQLDLIKDMTGADVNRNYYIFKDSLVGTGPMGSGPYRLTLYIAANESMMSFPALINGNTLQSGMGGTPLPVSSIGVNVSVGGNAPITATDNGDGTWQVDLVLSATTSNQIEVELTVNGERKTSDGTASGTNAVFMMMPGSM